MEASSSRRGRNSSFECLKLLGILLIILSHVLASSTQTNSFPEFSGLNVSLASTSLTRQVLAALFYSGELGNMIFFVCSAWFLLDRPGNRKAKALSMVLQIWTVSVLILAAALIHRGGKLSSRLILFSLFPTLFENNWYMTCYLLFYLIYPYLNRLIGTLDQRGLFRAALGSFLGYFCISFFMRLANEFTGRGTILFSSRIVIWVACYFIIAYVKRWRPRFLEGRGRALGLVLLGLAGYYGMVFLTNAAGLRIEALRGSLQLWRQQNNPFLLILVLGLVKLAQGRHFENRAVNYLSSLSLYIYIIHENMVFRLVYRPTLWHLIIRRAGGGNMVLWALVLTLGLFLVSSLCAACYRASLGRLVEALSARLYPLLRRRWLQIEARLISRDHHL